MNKKSGGNDDDPDAVNQHPTAVVMIIITETRTKTNLPMRLPLEKGVGGFYYGSIEGSVEHRPRQTSIIAHVLMAFPPRHYFL